MVLSQSVKDEIKESSGINPYIFAGVSDEQKKYYADCFVFAWETEEGKIEGFKVAGMGNNCSHYVFLEDTIVEYDSSVRNKLKKTRYIHSRWVRKVEKGVFDIEQ